MSHSPEQMRQKAEAMRKAEHHMKNSTVDGSPGRNHDGKDMMPMSNEYEEKMEHGE